MILRIGQRQVGRLARREAAEQLDEEAGARELGLEGGGEIAAALRKVVLGQDLDAELLEMGAHPLAFVVEIVGGLREQHRLRGSAERTDSRLRLGFARRRTARAPSRISASSFLS